MFSNLRTTSFTRYLTTFLFISLLFLISGCDNSVDPFDSESGLFSIYGYLTLSSEQHFIRVKNLNDPLVEGSKQGLDATVTLENLDTGTLDTLSDSIVVFDGISTHNFRTDQPIQPGAAYRLTVKRADGGTTQATATMPKMTRVDVDAEEVLDCDESVLLNFQNIPESNQLELSIAVNWDDKTQWVHRPNATTQTGIIPLRVVEQAVPDPALAAIEEPERYCTILDDGDMRIAYTHFGPDWPADSVLTDPTESLVENGLGVFGGLHQDTLNFTVNTDG
jgi:hypothetical protein